MTRKIISRPLIVNKKLPASVNRTPKTGHNNKDTSRTIHNRGGVFNYSWVTGGLPFQDASQKPQRWVFAGIYPEIIEGLRPSIDLRRCLSFSLLLDVTDKLSVPLQGRSAFVLRPQVVPQGKASFDGVYTERSEVLRTGCYDFREAPWRGSRH